MYLIAGLGNPGTKYEYTRHNIGFLALDEIARKFSSPPWVKKFKGEYTEAGITANKEQNAKHLLLKPQTFMNLSGESVSAAARFYKIPPDQIIVLYDDVDLPMGKLRVKQGGGHGGHNGLKSIDAHMGKEYWRVRIGIGRPEGAMQTADYVLGKFTPQEMRAQDQMLAAITTHFPLLLERQEASFMNKIALALQAL